MLCRVTSRMQTFARRCMGTRPVIKTSAGEGVSRVVVVAQPIEDPDNLKQWAHDTPINSFKDCKLKTLNDIIRTFIVYAWQLCF